MFQNNRLIIVVCTLLLGLIPGLTLALSSDKQQPVSIEADSASIDEGKNTATYQGNVILTQGSIHIRAGKIVVHNFQDDNARLVATGTPVHFTQAQDDTPDPVKARSLKVEYSLSDPELVFSGDAFLNKGKDSFANNRIIYDREKSIVKAGKSALGSGRVKVTIGPRKNTIPQ